MQHTDPSRWACCVEEQLGLGFTGKSLASKVAVSDLSCEYTIYFKEA